MISQSALINITVLYLIISLTWEQMRNQIKKTVMHQFSKLGKCLEKSIFRKLCFFLAWAWTLSVANGGDNHFKHEASHNSFSFTKSRLTKCKFFIKLQLNNSYTIVTDVQDIFLHFWSEGISLFRKYNR